MVSIPFSVLLFFLFLSLKLVGIIAWSWVWVTAPLWIGVAGSIVLLALSTLLALGLWKKISRR